jgi:hypothetical protein
MRSPRRKKRPWTPHEIRLYLALVWRKVPLLWAEVARRIGSRSPQQIRSHDEYVRRKVVQALCGSEGKALDADLPTMKGKWRFGLAINVLESLVLSLTRACSSLAAAIAARLRPDELRGVIPDAKLIELYGATPTGSPTTGSWGLTSVSSCVCFVGLRSYVLLSVGLTRVVGDGEVLTPPRTPVSLVSLDTVDVDGATSTVSSDIDDIDFPWDVDTELAIDDDWDPDFWPDNDEQLAEGIAMIPFPAEIQTS